jgi:hypothetical protein
MERVSGLLAAAHEAGLTVLVEGTTLRVRGPRAAEPVALRLLAEKEAILAHWLAVKERKIPLGDTCDTRDTFRMGHPTPARTADASPSGPAKVAPRPGVPLVAARPGNSQAAWHDFIQRWHGAYKFSAATTGQLFALALTMPTLDLGAGDERSRRSALERKLTELRGHVVAGYCIDGVGEHDPPKLWRLWPVSGPAVS